MAFSTRQQWNGWNFFVCFLVSMGQVAFGYPSSVISVTLAQPSFLVYMGLLDITKDPPAVTSNADSIIGAMSGVYLAGAVINVFIAGWVADMYGRKMAFHYCSLLAIFGGGIITGAQNSGMFIAGRLFSGAGSVGYLAVTPFYSAELAPPALRGLMVGMNGVNIAIGYALGSYMGLAFYYSKNPVTQWRAPLGIALIWPVVMIVVCFIVPESPRFLLMKGRIDEAREVVYSLHDVKGDTNHDFARAEFYQMAKQAEIDREMTPGWIEIFRKPAYRKRMLLASGLAFFGQSSGVLVLNNYGPTIYAALGYDTEKQLQLQAGWVTLGIVANLIGALVLDWVGRKPLLITGLAGTCVCLIVEAAMVASFAEEATNKAGLRMGVAATYLFLFIYSLGLDVAGVVFYSELFPNFLRARGLSFTIAVFALTNILYLQVAPTAFREVGWKFFLLFILLAAIGAVWVWIFVPETKAIPLEEMARIFGDEVAVYEADIHTDQKTHELVVERHGAQVTVEVIGAESGNAAVASDVEKGVPAPPTKAQHIESVQRH